MTDHFSTVWLGRETGPWVVYRRWWRGRDPIGDRSLIYSHSACYPSDVLVMWEWSGGKNQEWTGRARNKGGLSSFGWVSTSSTVGNLPRPFTGLGYTKGSDVDGWRLFERKSRREDIGDPPRRRGHLKRRSFQPFPVLLSFHYPWRVDSVSDPRRPCRP